MLKSSSGSDWLSGLSTAMLQVSPHMCRARMEAREITNAPNILKADIWTHFRSYEQIGKHKLDKLHAVCKACHTKMKHVGSMGAQVSVVFIWWRTLLVPQHQLFGQESIAASLFSACSPHCTTHSYHFQSVSAAKL